MPHPLVDRLMAGVKKGSVRISLYGDIKGWTFWIHERFRFDEVTWSIGPFATQEAAEANAKSQGVEGYSITDFRMKEQPCSP